MKAAVNGQRSILLYCDGCKQLQAQKSYEGWMVAYSYFQLPQYMTLCPPCVTALALRPEEGCVLSRLDGKR